jgi:hypothetical protein
MTPRLLPPQPQFASKAERLVWVRLRSQLPAEAFLAANVHLHSHEDFYEADLVVGLPGAGFAVIEVKGGHVEHRDDGWWQATHEGMKRIDPAAQADNAKRLLDTYVRSRGWRHGPIRFEHLVAFPDLDVGPAPLAPDLPRWAMIARGDLDDVADRIWTALDRRHTDKPRPTVDQVAELADLVGGRPEPSASLLGVAAAREQYVRRLTEQQYGILRALRNNPRVHATGGPGSGKTWLALEQARTWAEGGRRVLFVCYSVGLSRWLRRAVEVFPPKLAGRVTVGTYHSIGVGLGIEVPEPAGQAWWDVELPLEMSRLATPGYDCLVVDEAQDFADGWWPPLLALLAGEQIFVAGDDGQAVFARRRGRPPLPFVEYTLTENLRNTVQVARTFNPLGERMRCLGGDGPPVRFVPCTDDTATSTADAEVERLLDLGHPGENIALLTTRSRHESHRRTEATLGKDGHWDGFWMADEVFYGTVMGFKGLERRVVVLAVDGFHEGVARDVMYSGLSRARDQLVVCGDPDTIRAAAGEEVLRRLRDPDR